MADILNIVFLFACIIILSIRLVIAGGGISKLEGKVNSILISLAKTEDNNDKKE